jgi:hypothetical protein
MKFKFSPLILVCMATVAMHPLAAPESGLQLSESGTELFR